jgi:hypothetical protein
LLARRESEVVGDEQLRAGDDGQVVTVDDADAGGGQPNQ